MVEGGNGMIVVLKGIIGRGINGVAEIRITTDDEIDLTRPVVKFKGEIERMDSYWKDHPLAGEFDIYYLKMREDACEAFGHEERIYITEVNASYYN
jgi:hypothetical protein